jgi:hypothetical protein
MGDRAHRKLQTFLVTSYFRADLHLILREGWAVKHLEQPRVQWSQHNDLSAASLSRLKPYYFKIMNFRWAALWKASKLYSQITSRARLKQNGKAV